MKIFRMYFLNCNQKSENRKIIDISNKACMFQYKIKSARNKFLIFNKQFFINLFTTNYTIINNKNHHSSSPPVMICQYVMFSPVVCNLWLKLLT